MITEEDIDLLKDRQPYWSNFDWSVMVETMNTAAPEWLRELASKLLTTANEREGWGDYPEAPPPS